MTLKRFCFIGMFTVATLTAGCGGGPGGEAAGSWQAVIDTVGDTIVVRTVSGSVWGDTAYLEPELSIGMLEGPDEYLIGNPRALAVSEDGRIYVLDRQVMQVRVYGPDGTHLFDIGREGGGPGEFEGPDGMTMLPDGRLLVRDPGNARVAEFAPDGEYLGQFWLAGGFNTSRRFYADTAGNSYAMVLLDADASVFDWRFGLVRYDRNGEVRDTIPAPRWDYERPQVSASREGSTSINYVPFTGQDWWTFSPLGYMVGGLSTDYRIDLFRVDAPVLRIERDWIPIAVKPEEAEERERRQTAGFRRNFGSWSWNGPPIPDTKPPFRNVFTSAEGNIWVVVSQEGRATMTVEEAREEERRTNMPPLRFEEPAAFDVFTPDGRYLGHVRVPDALRPSPEPIVRGDSVWAVARDELDVPRIVRYRIVHP
ncbi:MAG: 6-bladed beta-propeller [Gemmatimonadales bacterium]|jgi:sugar lactone lactonase YvrE